MIFSVLSLLGTSTKSATFEFSWSAPIQSSAITVFDVRYDRAKIGQKAGAWHLPKSWQGTSATSDHLTMKKGYAYRVEVRAHDVAGKVSGWTKAQKLTRTCVDLPLAPPESVVDTALTDIETAAVSGSRCRRGQGRSVAAYGDRAAVDVRCM